MNNKYKDITGQRFNKLTAIKFSHNGNSGAYWEFLCDCGKIKIIRLSCVKDNTTKSCGCYKRNLRIKHGLYNSSIYSCWNHMINRCNNKDDHNYKNYGGRGIKICDEWLKIENFYKDMGDCPKNMTLDRINNDGNYCKENCRWATKKQQNRNYRRNRLIIFNGEKKCLIEWAEIYGIEPHTLSKRLKKGWPLHKAFNANDHRIVTITYKGETRCALEWSKIKNINYGTLLQRFHKGWTNDRLFYKKI